MDQQTESSKAAKPTKIQRHEQRFYGKSYCLTLFQQRASDIISVHLRKDRLRDFSPLLKWCAKNKKAYHFAEDVELARLAKSEHHEGIVILARKKLKLSEADFIEQIKSKNLGATIVALENIGNPHNAGAILRNASFFGVKSLVDVSPVDRGAILSSSACRVSEGGAEFIDVYECQSLANIISAARAADYAIVATSAKATTDMYRYEFPENTLLVFGSEHHGISEQARKNADTLIRIPTDSPISSLNVAAASAAVLALRCQQKSLTH